MKCFSLQKPPDNQTQHKTWILQCWAKDEWIIQASKNLSNVAPKLINRFSKVQIIYHKDKQPSSARTDISVIHLKDCFCSSCNLWHTVKHAPSHHPSGPLSKMIMLLPWRMLKFPSDRCWCFSWTGHELITFSQVRRTPGWDLVVWCLKTSTPSV